MKLSELITNNMVMIQVEYTDRIHEFPSRVLGKKDDVLILSVISVDGRIIRLPQNSKVNIYCQLLNKLYIWKNVSLENLHLHGKSYHRIKNANIEGKPYNRRGAYRLPVNEELSMEFIFEGNGSISKNVYVANVSESGLCFKSNVSLKQGMKVRLLYNTAAATFDMTANIVRKYYDSEKKLYFYGCKINEFDELLSSFIIKEQIRRRKSIA